MDRTESERVGPPELEGSLRAALRRYILTLADSKRLMGIRYSDWVLGAPSLEANIAATSMAQDEWGHARLLYALLKGVGESPREIEHERAAEAYASVDVLDSPLDDWAEVVAAMMVVDGALTAALASFAEGSYEPARGRVPKMITEEAFHRDFALAWFNRLAQGSEEGRDRLAGATLDALPRTLAWLDPRDWASEALAAAGFTADGSTTVRRYRDTLRQPLSLVGIDVDAVDGERAEWDEARGRGPGHPGEEAVERARGDLNRALLVE